MGAPKSCDPTQKDAMSHLESPLHGADLALVAFQQHGSFPHLIRRRLLRHINPTKLLTVREADARERFVAVQHRRDSLARFSHILLHLCQLPASTR